MSLDTRITIVRYPTARLLSFEETVECAVSQIPASQPPVVIAESFSGPVAVRMIASGLVKARALVLCATFARPPHPIAWRIAHFFRLPLLIGPNMPRAFFRHFIGDERQIDALLPLWKKVHAEVPRQILTSRLSLINHLDVTGDLRKLVIPCLYLQAENDRIVPAKCLKDFEQNVPHLSVRKIKAPHFILQAQPESCLMAIKEFLLTSAAAPPGDHLETLKQQVADLQKSEAFFRAISQNSSDITMVVNTRAVITYVNPSVEKFLGYKPEELIGKSGFDYIVPAEIPRALLDFGKSILTRGTKIPNAFSIRHKNGSIRVLEGIGINLLFDPVVQGFVMNARDVTDRRKIEEELDASRRHFEELVTQRTTNLSLINAQLLDELAERKKTEKVLTENEERYRDFVDNAPVGVAIVDLEGKVRYINGRIENAMGWSRDEIIGRDGFGLEAFDQQMRKTLEDKFKALISDDTQQLFEIPVSVKDGRRVWVELIATQLKRNGVPAGALVVFVNLEERKRAEEERKSLAEKLHRAEKMESLGTLAGGIAHELNNIMGVLVGYSEMVMMKMTEEDPLKKHMRNVMQSIEKASSIIEDMQILAGRGVRVSKIVSFNNLLEDFFQTPEFERLRSSRPRVTLKKELDGSLLNMQGSPAHLEKSIMNLIANAYESVSREGEITIRTGNSHLDRPLPGYDTIRPGDYSLLTISDNGPGIHPVHVDKIFEPFYTRKVMGRPGTGLELAVVWGIVKDHQGYMDVQTGPGKGTAFTLYLPSTGEPLSPRQQTPVPDSYAGKGESILLVDDMPEQRDMAQKLLTRLGYSVQTAASGEQALEHLKNNPASVLILDMLMDPGIDGLTTYKRALEINPKQKAIIVSGFTETESVKQALELGASAYVHKPYLTREIGAAIRKALSEK